MIIEANNLVKIYKALNDINFRNFFKAKVKEVKALNGISFSIDSNEFVGLIGVNGAGKSTTIKILTGILEPTSGEVRVLGRVPSKSREVNNFKIGVVFGQRCQLRWDLPPIESYKLLKEIYRINNANFNNRLEYFSSLLGVNEIMDRPVRSLSLGEKMRAELCAAFLHDPEIVFLDEPTIGLDIFSKEAILSFLKKVKSEKKITLILTSHDLSNIEEVCDRIIILDKGKIIVDGQKEAIIGSFDIGSQINFTMKDENIIIPEIVKTLPYRVSKNSLLVNGVPKNSVPAVISEVLKKNLYLLGIEIKDPDLEDIVRQVYVRKDKNIL